MTERNLYSTFEQSKTGEEVAVFYNSHWMFSKYAPNRDVELFLSQITEKPQAIVIGGVGSAIHIKKALQKSTIKLIIAVEENEKSLDFCKEKLQFNNEKLIFCTIQTLNQTLKQFYIPLLHGDLTFLPIKTWLDNIEDKETFYKVFDSTVKEIAADVSTQAFFGKIWHSNILKNLKTIEIFGKQKKSNNKIIIDTNKTAAIIGAGPSLDKNIENLSKNRESFFIIATDTSFRVLENAKIVPDCVVTLDGQALSTSHFIGTKAEISFFVFDLCANNSVVNKLAKKSKSIIPVTSGHPLVELYCKWLESKKLPNFITKLTAGNGTVLQLALDFAFNAGFSDFKFFGADFAFLQNKAYCKGTYLEDNFLQNSELTNSFENQNVKLMFKNLTQKVDNAFTTPVLQSYKEYLLSYLEQIKTKNHLQPKFVSYKVNFFDYTSVCYDEFLSWLLEKLEKKDENILFSLLPLAAWINKRQENSDIYKEALYFTRRHRIT